MELLKPNTSYHIFNHANGFENVFRDDENYRYFLEKYRKYIFPIARTYAYCLMPNHFHLVICIRKSQVIEEIIRNRNVLNLPEADSKKVDRTISGEEIEKYLSKQFGNLFSCYTQSFNKVYNRSGSLFIKNFKREPIHTKQHFMITVIYVHRNPIHHGFCNSYVDWSYSSYCEITEEKSMLIDLPGLFRVFDGKQEFIDRHQQNAEKFIQTFNLDAP